MNCGEWFMKRGYAAGAVSLGLIAMAGQGTGVSDSNYQRPQEGRQKLTFNKDIAPIVFQHCTACHRPGQSAPFSLLSYAEVKKRAKQVAEVVGRHYMPPW